MAFIVWTGVEEWMTEAAGVVVHESGLGGNGIQIGADPVPYRVGYQLNANDGFVTRAVDLASSGDGWSRRLELIHDGSGRWEVDLIDDVGEVPGGPWDGTLPDLSQALDIDIENSPLTNTMPILRHGFQRGGSGDFVMAFIRTPSLRVEASPQRYEHVRTTEGGSVVRYISRDGDFTADLELDSDGLLAHYPRLARRVEPGLKVG
ncbi:MAG: putative glycolipid-binding domain-containing protein [Solirubrobacterales bacterium]